MKTIMQKYCPFSGLISSALAVALIIMMFTFVKMPTKGHLETWILAIVAGAINILFVAHVAYHKWENRSIQIFVSLGAILLLNIFMGVFSLVDIVGNGNHYISGVLFVTVPWITVISLTIIK